jgi:hypothetical protein
MAQGSGFDMNKLSNGEKLVGGAAIAYVIWTFIPSWYSCCDVEGVTVGAGGVNGFRGFMILAWILALVAIAEIVTRRFANMNLNLPVKTGQLHLIVGAVALVCTVLGLVVKPSAGGFGFSVSASLSWGIFVGIAIAAVWTYGAYMMYSQPAETVAGGGSVPPPPSPGGFTS